MANATYRTQFKYRAMLGGLSTAARLSAQDVDSWCSDVGAWENLGECSF